MSGMSLEVIFSFEDAADDVLVAFAFDRVFLEDAVFEECDAALEFFHIDDEAVAAHGVGLADAE